MSLSISFQGAARTVTGSRHQIRSEIAPGLFDCGLYQGHREEAEHVNRNFAFAPADVTRWCCRMRISTTAATCRRWRRQASRADALHAADRGSGHVHARRQRVSPGA
jgi:hypothetical protein